MTLPTFDLEFTKDGAVFDPNQLKQVLDAVGGFTDLLIYSHGWNNDIADARTLYDKMQASFTRVKDLNLVTGIADRKFAVLRVFWPSKRFADSDLIPGGGAASATMENDASLQRILEDHKNDPNRLGGKDIPAARAASLTHAQQLVKKLATDPQACDDFVKELRSLLNSANAQPEDGTTDFFTLKPSDLFKQLSGSVTAPIATGAGGGAGFKNAGGATGLVDGLNGVLAAARRIANYATYYQMKDRAGVVGTAGLGPVCVQLRGKKPDVRLHLIGHSFGGRLVTAAAAALPDNTTKVSLSLLQSAYSHNGLAKQFDGKNDGFFRSVLTKSRVSGPVIITHTKNDQAVGIAYPLASRIANQKAAALGDENDPYGGLGRNGAQHTPEAEGNGTDLKKVGGQYKFQTGKVFNLNADNFIKDHSDITGLEVAFAILTLIASI